MSSGEGDGVSSTISCVEVMVVGVVVRMDMVSILFFMVVVEVMVMALVLIPLSVGSVDFLLAGTRGPLDCGALSCRVQISEAQGLVAVVATVVSSSRLKALFWVKL